MPERAIILVVDDSADDICLIRKALERAHVPNPVFAVNNGDEAISYLKGEGRYSNRDEFPLPDLVLLDLKMPGIDGFEVLRWIRHQPGLSSMRVLVLTSSGQIRDVNQAYGLGANSFMVKPDEFEDFVHLSKTLSEFWLRQSEAPETYRSKTEQHAKDWRPPPPASKVD